MYTTYKLTMAAIRMFVRNKQALFFTLFMPFAIMLIFGYIGFDKPQKTDIGIVTGNMTPQTAQFIDGIQKVELFTVHDGPLQDEIKELNEGNRSVVLLIPGDTLPSSGGQNTITAYINAGKAGEAQAVISILNQQISQMTLASANLSPAIAIEQNEVNASNLRYIEFLLPGLIALSVMQMSVFSVAFVFTQYKEKGVLKRLLATPMKPYQFVAANAVTRLVVSVVQAFIFIVMGILLFQVHIVGSFALLFLTVVLGALMFLGLGFTISGLAKTVDSVPAIANLVVFPMLFLGGTFFPLSNMPGWLEAFAKILPLTFFSTPLREIMTKGAGFGDIAWDLGAMVIWSAILIFAATITFRFQEKDSA